MSHKMHIPVKIVYLRVNVFLELIKFKYMYALLSF